MKFGIISLNKNKLGLWIWNRFRGKETIEQKKYLLVDVEEALKKINEKEK